jgi:hypothetical protein
VDLNVALHVGDDLAGTAAERFGPIDPEHGFFAFGGDGALIDLHCAAEDPDFISALPPMGRTAGADADRLGYVANGEIDGGSDGAGSDQSKE